LNLPYEFEQYFLGFNIKKAIRVRGLDFNGLGTSANMKVYRCKMESINKIENAQKELAYQWEQGQSGYDSGENIQYEEAIAK
jgi:uncharacterized protein YggL (DUF469 family)